MKGILKMIKPMEKENAVMLMEQLIKEILRIIHEME
jgi:hypothetical protein